MIQVILHIDAAFGIFGQQGPGHEGIQAVVKQQKPGLPGMGVYLITPRFAKPGIFCVCVSIGLRPIKIFRQGGTTADQQQYHEQKDTHCYNEP